MRKKNEIKKYDANILENIGRDGENLSLTDLWKAAGSDENKRPAEWRRLDSTQQLIEAVGSVGQYGLKTLWSTRRVGDEYEDYRIV